MATANNYFGSAANDGNFVYDDMGCYGYENYAATSSHNCGDGEQAGVICITPTPNPTTAAPSPASATHSPRPSASRREYELLLEYSYSYGEQRDLVAALADAQPEIQISGDVELYSQLAVDYTADLLGHRDPRSAATASRASSTSRATSRSTASC
ncbi:hypothetical protein JL720_12515 [Aureococcus anophagefferens]|nr:hypothetical protein JL720_12515 [Aureococcus anophagefferens]